jgi:hypothetical protein
MVMSRGGAAPSTSPGLKGVEHAVRKTGIVSMLTIREKRPRVLPRFIEKCLWPSERDDQSYRGSAEDAIEIRELCVAAYAYNVTGSFTP